MRDGPLRIALKAVVRGIWTLELRLRRRASRLRGPPRYRLGGACQSCAKCCERPTLRVDKLTWYWPTLRRLFLGWQRRVNGFELVEADRASQTFAFRCTHFDPQTRRCDSYGSRPGLCRDYPRALLAQPWPEFFDGCGFRPVARDGAGLAAALEATELDEEARAVLRRGLKLD